MTSDHTVTLAVLLDLETPYIPPPFPSAADGLLALIAGMERHGGAWRDRMLSEACLEPLPPDFLPVAVHGRPGREWFRVSCAFWLPPEGDPGFALALSKRFHAAESDLVACRTRKVQVKRGPTKHWHVPCGLRASAVPRLRFWADVPEGRKDEFESLVMRLRGRCVGKKAAWGYGRVGEVSVAPASSGFSVMQGLAGQALRPIPEEDARALGLGGPRMWCAWRPPYWGTQPEMCVVPPYAWWRGGFFAPRSEKETAKGSA